MIKLSKTMQAMLLSIAKYRDPMRGIYGHTEKARAGRTLNALMDRELVTFGFVGGVELTERGQQVVDQLWGEP